jgi:hypothetical protein
MSRKARSMVAMIQIHVSFYTPTYCAGVRNLFSITLSTFKLNYKYTNEEVEKYPAMFPPSFQALDIVSYIMYTDFAPIPTPCS